jgi:hypothetical protein
MRETGGVPVAVPEPVVARRRPPAAACALLGLLGLLAGCSNSGSGGGAVPNTAGSASVVPGEAPKLGEGAGGGISVTGTSIVRTGTKLAISAQIHSDESTPDELTAVGSNVGPTLALASPLKIPAGGTVSIGGQGTRVVLTQSGRLEPGGTVALSMQFGSAGNVQVFSSFLEAS